MIEKKQMRAYIFILKQDYLTHGDFISVARRSTYFSFLHGGKKKPLPPFPNELYQ